MNNNDIAKKLREKAAALLQAAEILEGEGGSLHSLPPTPKNHGGTRVEQLVALLQHQGPMARAEIMKTTGIPRGTLGVIMVKKNGFRQDGQGRWFFGGK